MLRDASLSRVQDDGLLQPRTDELPLIVALAFHPLKQDWLWPIGSDCLGLFVVSFLSLGCRKVAIWISLLHNTVLCACNLGCSSQPFVHGRNAPPGPSLSSCYWFVCQFKVNAYSAPDTIHTHSARKFQSCTDMIFALPRSTWLNIVPVLCSCAKHTSFQTFSPSAYNSVILLPF